MGLNHHLSEKPPAKLKPYFKYNMYDKFKFAVNEVEHVPLQFR